MKTGKKYFQNTKGHQKYTETKCQYLKRKGKNTPESKNIPTPQPRKNLRPLEEKEKKTTTKARQTPRVPPIQLESLGISSII
jgi:hypothetical protein